MKFSILLFVFVAAASAKETFKLPQAVIDKVYKMAKPCADENNVDYNLVRKIVDGTLPRDDATNNFLFCVSKNSGYVTEEGRLVVDKLAQVVKDHPLAKEFQEGLIKCSEILKENPIATTIALNICIVDLPIRFLFD